MDDYDYYGYSEEEAKAQAAADRASTGLMYAVFRLIFIPFRLFFLLLPSVFCAFLILQWLHKPFTKTTQWDYFWWLCGTVYIIECLIFFLKGWQLSLRNRGNRFWMFIIGICILSCFVLPAIMFQVIISSQFKRPSAAHMSTLDVIAWIVGIALGWLIYRRYRLTEDNAPFLFRWTFWIGRSL